MRLYQDVNIQLQEVIGLYNKWFLVSSLNEQTQMITELPFILKKVEYYSVTSKSLLIKYYFQFLKIAYYTSIDQLKLALDENIELYRFYKNNVGLQSRIREARI